MSNGKVTVQWLGHATFILTDPEGFRIVVDPWLEGNPACPDALKQPDDIQLILATHGHFDHIGDCVPLAKRTGAPVVGIFELCAWLNRKGVENTRDMNKGGTQSVGPVRVTMVHADHSCGITDGDEIVYGGEAVGYIIHFSNGLRVWHMGDTAVFGDMALIADLYRPDVILMPIGDHYVMSPEEAARAVRLTGTRRVIPMHFGTFPALTGTPEALRQLCSDVPGLEITEMSPGEVVSLP